MKPTTNVCLAARNVGFPNESLLMVNLPLSEALIRFAKWCREQDMTKRFEIMIARDETEVTDWLNGSGRRRSATSMDSTFDEMLAAMNADEEA